MGFRSLKNLRNLVVSEKTPGINPQNLKVGDKVTMDDGTVYAVLPGKMVKVVDKRGNIIG